MQRPTPLRRQTQAEAAAGAILLAVGAVLLLVAVWTLLEALR